MNSRIVLLVFLLSIFSCSHAYHWAKAEATQQEWTKDSNECERYAKEQVYFEECRKNNLAKKR